jgi:Ca-activated chloride channel homolog
VCIFVREGSAAKLVSADGFAVKNTQANSFFLSIVLCLSAATALTAIPACAQSAPTVTVQQALKTRTELVKLDVSVLDDKGDFVDGLTEQDFHVSDSGSESPILYFAPVTDAAKVVVVLETSPALFLIKDEHLAAAYALVNGLGADDQVALVSYSDVPRELMPFTTDKMQLLNALGNIQYMMGSTNLNLYATVSNLLGGLARYPGKKAIVLLTTGLDSSEPSQWTALTEKLRGSDVVIFSVGLLGPATETAAESGKHSKKIPRAAALSSGVQDDPTLAKADQALVDLSKMTGGQAFFPQSAQGFAPIYRQIAACLRNEYVIGVSPEHDGQFHQLSVTVTPGSGSATPDGKKHKKKKKKKKHGGAEYHVYFRQGYVAPKA